MCPLCFTSLAITVATTLGGGGAAVALAVRVKRALRKSDAHQTSAPKGST